VEAAADRPPSQDKNEEVCGMRSWTRLQDWVTLVAGLYAALSPIWVSTSGERSGAWALIILGALVVVSSLVALAMPALAAAEWLTALVGVLLFVAPWVLGFTDRVGASWTAWVVGAIAVVLGGFTGYGLSSGGRPGRQAMQP
jgi:hypothetical protein